VYQHHERCDGTGYPRGLTKEHILLSARIIAVADVVEAITSMRPYRAALGIEVALEEISNHRSTRYDEKVVDAAIELFTEDNYAIPEG
jgi:HD-GYP domain-containing protein (c-di-GMP phosphodiesterase class II)